MIAILRVWRAQTPDARRKIGSSRVDAGEVVSRAGPDSLMRNHIAPAAKRAAIAKHIHPHLFRHKMPHRAGESDEDGKA
jgi:integrase